MRAASGGARKIAQDVVQHAAVADIVDLDLGIDPAAQRDLAHAPVRIGDRAGHRRERPEVALEPADRHRLVALEAEGAARLAARELEGDDAHAHEVTREEAGEGAAGAEGGDDLDDLAVLLAVDVREGEDELLVHLVREEDAVEDEGEAQADGEDRSVVEEVLVGEVGVTQERVAVDGLRREGQGDDEEGQGPAGDEEVLRLAADEVEGGEADGAEEGDSSVAEDATIRPGEASLAAAFTLLRPCVDGVDTKSQHNSSKSSSTSTLPSPNCETEPIPRDEIPTVMLFLNSSFNMFPDGVVNISILPSKSFPSHHNCLMLCDAFFRLITEDSGWSNSPNALFSAIGPDIYLSTSRFNVS